MKHRSVVWGTVAGVIFLASLLSGMVQAEDLTVGLYTGGSPPLFFNQKSKNTGIYVDILNKVGKLTGLHFKYEYYPTKRVMALFEAGKIDVEPGINPAWRSSAKVKGIFSIPFATAQDVVVFQPGKLKSVKTPADLKGMNVGAIYGFYYVGGWMAAFSKGLIHRKNSVNEDQLMLKLAHGRLDTIFIRKEAAEYRIKTNPAFKGLVIGNAIETENISFRIRPGKPEWVKKINNAIEKMKKSGSIAAIYAQYR